MKYLENQGQVLSPRERQGLPSLACDQHGRGAHRAPGSRRIQEQAQLSPQQVLREHKAGRHPPQCNQYSSGQPCQSLILLNKTCN